MGNQLRGLSWSEFSEKLKHYWEVDGSISKSVELVRTHPEFEFNTGNTGRKQRMRAIGAEKLAFGDVIIPPRTKGALFSPEQSRVMYCVYSTPVFNSNGYSTRTRGVANGIKSAGGDVVVVARAGYPWDWKADSEIPKANRHVESLDGIEYVHLPNGHIGELSPSQHVEATADAFVREAFIQRPRVIQSASNYRTALPALIAARRVGVPFVYEVRGLWEITGASNNPKFGKSERFTLMKDFESRIARNADIVLAITRQVADELVCRGVDPDKIFLAPNAVDPTLFFPRPADVSLARSLGVRGKVPTIGFAGSIVKYEGLETLLEASNLLHHRGIEHQIVLCGSGNTEERLKSKANQNSMEWVKFLGRLPQEDIPPLLSTFDIIVTPRDSTVITELVSALKPLEAFASGRATVLSDVAPNVDLAGEDQSRSLLFRAGDPESLADTLSQLIESPERRGQLGKHARYWIENERNWQAIGESILSSHQKAIRSYQDSCLEGIPNQEIDIAAILSETLSNELESHCTLKNLQVNNVQSHLESIDFDLLIVEFDRVLSDPQWSWRILTGGKDLAETIGEVVEKFKARGIPTVLIASSDIFRSEDQSVREERLKLAANFDLVLATSLEGMLDLYKNVFLQNTSIGSFPGLFSPQLHNPVVIDGQESKEGISLTGLIEGDELNPKIESILSFIKHKGATQGSITWEDKDGRCEETPIVFGDDERPNQDILAGPRDYSFFVSNLRSEISPTLLYALAEGALVFGSENKALEDWMPATIASDLKEAETELLFDAANQNREFLREVQWHQLRKVYRSFTSEKQLALLLRTLGIPLRFTGPSPVVCETNELTCRVADRVLQQSVRPDAVFSRGQIQPEAEEKLQENGIQILTENIEGALVIRIEPNSSRTFIEDILILFSSGSWDFVSINNDLDDCIARPVDGVAMQQANMTAYRGSQLNKGLEARLSFVPVPEGALVRGWDELPLVVDELQKYIEFVDSNARDIIKNLLQKEEK